MTLKVTDPKYSKKDARLRDHCHINVKYRGSAH